MSKMKLKTIVAFVIILVVAPPLYFGGNLLQALLILVSALGSLEIASLTDQKKHWFLSLMTLAAVMAMYYINRIRFRFTLYLCYLSRWCHKGISNNYLCVNWLFLL